MLFYNRTIHEIEKVFSERKDLADTYRTASSMLPKRKNLCFFGEAGKRKYLCMLYISLLPEFIHQKK